MNISAQRFATKTRTSLFIAGLTAMNIGVGALIGGRFLYGFVALAVVMHVFDYWFSERLALQASRAKPAQPGARRGRRARLGPQPDVPILARSAT
jgi:hypothetical protein